MNQIELSPNYAGTLRGASSTVANICGFATPAVVGALTKGQVYFCKNETECAKVQKVHYVQKVKFVMKV